MPLTTTRETKLLFIGDSITDCGRRNDTADQLGGGYVRIVRDHLLVKHPDSAPRVINMGISGNKVTDLQARWQGDVLDHQPDILSVFVGINDVWHGLSPTGTGVPIDRYVETYRQILSQLPSTTKLVLCHPSCLWLKQPENSDALMLPYCAAVDRLAQEFKAVAVVRLNAAFNRVNRQRPEFAWTTDGVHPTSAGHTLIAREWLTATGLW
jgi:acyl-CoA thioesterase I